METATAIMVVAKRSQGGLGYAKIELNRRVDVPNEFKYLAKAGYFEIDVYAPASGTGLNTTARTILINSAARRMRSA